MRLMIGAVGSDYRILISRSPQRPKAQLYAFNLKQQIPAFPIPLRTGEQEPLIELQPLLHRVYDRARLELAIDYNKPCTPKLSNDIRIGLGQCVAQMVAAQIFNSRKGMEQKIVYGSVSTGTNWKFLMLENNVV